MQINNSFQKNANISMVAQLLWRTPGISRVEIARILDLYRSTVSNIINTLIENGFVAEEKEGSAMPQGGRKPICLGLNARFGCVAGIEMQPSGYHAVLCDIFGTVLFSAGGPLPEGTPSEMAKTIAGSIVPVSEKLEVSLLGICVGIPGIVDGEKGVVIRSDPFRLENDELARALGSHFSVPVFVENDANCLAWLEIANNRENALSGFLCLNAEFQKKGGNYGEYSGMGLGMGIALGDRVYAGSRCAAGEYFSVSWKKGNAGQTGLPCDTLSRLENDPAAFGEWVADLFSSLVPVVAALDPEVVFLHGALARRADEVRRTIDTRVEQFSAILDKTASRLAFGDGDPLSVARGAAMMYYLKLLAAPGGALNAVSTVADWDAVFRLSGKTKRSAEN